MRYQTVNRLLGWIVFAMSLAVYTLTLEPSVSMWDCGEFTAAADKLQVVHQPGAPLFLMVGRLFALFSSTREGVSIAVNMLSATCSALTVMFTFWITTYFAAKIVRQANGGKWADFTIFSAGLVASMALTFSDTFWFSAVEAEVYAMSSFFTAFNVWAATRWESDKSPYAGKWLVLIAYCVGLSIGTHLLSLLVIPSVACMYYFRHFKYSRKGFFYCLISGLAVLMFVQKIIIPGIPALLKTLDLFFVNSLGMGFWSGVFAGILIIGGVVGYGIYYTRKKSHIHLAFICLAYILLGYGSYSMVVIRSNEPLPIDMSNPEEPFNLADYINRAQYEERPLVYGPYFNAKPVEVKNTGDLYRKDSTQYTHIGEKQEYAYDPAYNTFFPRMGDMQKDGSPSGYRYWGGMNETNTSIDNLERQIGETADQTAREELRARLEELKAEKPTMANNLQFFFSYQINHMYLRYFMWNFAGRQNDKQGHSYNRFTDGNWISGINIIDYMRLGPQAGLPDYLEMNKGRNRFFLLPLIIGILGMVVQYKKGRKDFATLVILFLYTGILINIFLNQPPFEPRERDYVHVGSFQVFCIWIGLGVIWLLDLLKKKTSPAAASVISAIAAFSAPVIMAQQGWDDHDRSRRYLAIDFARNYLNSCPPNAILLGNADNDTYPLWYAQNVEGIRKDVRIINQNLLPSDWYSMAMLEKVYDSEPLPLTLGKQQLAAGENEYFQYEPLPGHEKPVDLRTFIRQLLSEPSRTFHTRQFTVPVNREAALRSGVVRAEDSANIAKEILINFPSRGIHKGDLLLLDLIATNAERGWKRPICFSTIAGNEGFINLEPYFERTGLVYQLVPIHSQVNGGQVSRLNTKALQKQLMHEFRYSGMKEKRNFYLDDKSDIAASSLQQCFIALAAEYLDRIEDIHARDSSLSDPQNRIMTDSLKRQVVALIDKCDREIPESVLVTKGQTKLNMAVIRQRTDNDTLAKKHLQDVFRIAKQEILYYTRFQGRKQDNDYIRSIVYEAHDIIGRAVEYSKKWDYKDIVPEMENTMKELGPRVKNYLQME